MATHEEILKMAEGLSAEELSLALQSLVQRTTEAQAERQELRERQEQALRQSFEEKEGISIHISDEHAEMKIAPLDLSFYFGADEPWCKTHKKTAEGSCFDDDDCETEWGFVIRWNQSEIMRVGASELHPDLSYDDIEQCLLCGIGLWLRRYIGRSVT